VRRGSRHHTRLLKDLLQGVASLHSQGRKHGRRDSIATRCKSINKSQQYTRSISIARGEILVIEDLRAALASSRLEVPLVYRTRSNNMKILAIHQDHRTFVIDTDEALVPQSRAQQELGEVLHQTQE